MNLAKSAEFFDPSQVKEKINIIGCGSVGSTIAELLARFGLTNVNLYDFDVVEIIEQVSQAIRESLDKRDAAWAANGNP